MTLQIISLEIDSFKRITAKAKITPENNLVIIGGKNKQGKTSVLDAIWFNLNGGDAGREITMPIHEGQSRASVKMELGYDGVVTLIVLREWWIGKPSTLTVTVPGERKSTSPQRELDKLLSKRSFDPNAFATQKGKEQVETLLKAVTLPFDPAAKSAERKVLYDQRTAIGQRAEDAKGVAASFNDLPTDTSTEEQSMSSVLAELDAARAHNTGVAQLRQKANEAWADHQVMVSRIATLQNELREAEEAEVKLREYSDATVAEAQAATPKDEEPIIAKMSTLEESNALARRAQAAAVAHEKWAELKAAYDAKTADIEALDKYRKDELAKVKFPDPALSFDDTGVLHNGRPFAQASAAEQWRSGILLTMATNPELRIIRITDGSLFDEDSMRALEEVAIEYDFQVWIELVGNEGIVFDDGEIIVVNERKPGDAVNA